jgi:hypothetical protein
MMISKKEAPAVVDLNEELDAQIKIFKEELENLQSTNKFHQRSRDKVQNEASTT